MLSLKDLPESEMRAEAFHPPAARSVRRSIYMNLKDVLAVQSTFFIITLFLITLPL